MKYFYFLRQQWYNVINYSRLRVNKASFKKVTINGLFYIQNRGGVLQIGNNFTASSGKHKNPIGGDTLLRLIVFTKNAKLTIGNNVGISNSSIVCWDKIEIGNNVLIGGGCKIWDTNFHSVDPRARTNGNDTDIKTAPVKIGDNVFIGGSVIILKGVTIGENSIIAAGSVIHKSIPANVIAGGNPCEVIKAMA